MHWFVVHQGQQNTNCLLFGAFILETITRVMAHRPPFCSEMRTALAFLASVAAACAFAPTLPSHGRVSLKRTSPVCSAQGSAVLQPFADRRALKVGCGTRGLLRVERA